MGILYLNVFLLLLILSAMIFDIRPNQILFAETNYISNLTINTQFDILTIYFKVYYSI